MKTRQGNLQRQYKRLLSWIKITSLFYLKILNVDQTYLLCTFQFKIAIFSKIITMKSWAISTTSICTRAHMQNQPKQICCFPSQKSCLVSFCWTLRISFLLSSPPHHHHRHFLPSLPFRFFNHIPAQCVRESECVFEE